MFKMLRFALATIAFAAATMSSAASGDQSGPGAASGQQSVAVKADDKVVCRTDETIGSRLHPTKICMTVAQWRRQNRDAADEVRRATGATPRSGG